jgi:hypothetical protein
MGYIENLINDVEETHKNLGELMAISQIVVKARKMALLISPSGCGKSTAMYPIGKNTENSIMPDKISIAGLALMADKLSGFKSVIVVDDITTTQTEYARKTTITTLTALVYTHRVQTIMSGQEFTIDDFHGSALVGVQPIILKSLMMLDEWDGSIQDKVLRYYHMYRPIEPMVKYPTINYNSGIDIEKVNDFEPDIDNKYWHKLIELGYSQWSRARTLEHLKDMLKAIASLENRYNVIYDDYALLARLLKPMAIENIVVVKEQLEGERYLNNTLLLLMVEYFTYGGKFSLAQVAQDYKMSLQQCYKIMATQAEYWQQITKSPTIYRPTDKLKKELNAYELELKNVD